VPPGRTSSVRSGAILEDVPSSSSGLVLAAAGVALLGLAAWLLSRRAGRKEAGRSDLLLAEVSAARQASESIDRRFEELRRAVEARAQAVERTVALGQSSVGEHLGQIREKMGRVFEASQRIEKLATDMTRLEDLLKPPKIRGGLGETFLEQALEQVLPRRFWEMQHRFPGGEVVDAAIMLNGRIVPVDSKFPLENYRKSREAASEEERRHARRDFAADVRRHVETIRAKYIRPEAGTYEFALMYVPAEALYCEIAGEGEEDSLADFAMERRVIPVSPRLLYAYLATVAMGLKGLELQEGAREIHARLTDLGRNWERVEAPFAKLGAHLGNTQKQYEEAVRALDRFAAKLEGLAEKAEEKLEEEIEAAPPLPPS
jgi:DNA recombination protein RmuC